MLARQYRMPAVDLSRFEVEPKILKLLTPDIAIKHTVLPLKREGRTLTVAIADPNNVTAIEDIKFITRCDVFPVIAGNTSQDRKSTRLNSSHVAISYAVFCLKKKKKKS